MGSGKVPSPQNLFEATAIPNFDRISPYYTVLTDPRINGSEDNQGFMVLLNFFKNFKDKKVDVKNKDSGKYDLKFQEIF